MFKNRKRYYIELFTLLVLLALVALFARVVLGWPWLLCGYAYVVSGWFSVFTWDINRGSRLWWGV